MTFNCDVLTVLNLLNGFISHEEKQLQILTINHLSFTDDIYLICFPSVGRQPLLNIRLNYATEHIVCYITQTTLILCALN